MELLERSALLDELRAASAKAVGGGGGRLVVLEGEAGVGKSSVLRAIARQPAGGARVLWGGCDALFTPRPLGPLRDMAARGAETAAARLAGSAPVHEIFDGLLLDLAVPTIAVMEDLHWADEATLDLLRFVGRRVEATPSIVIGSYREDEVGPDHPLRAVLGDLATSVTRYRVEPLSPDAVRLMAVGHDVDPAALHRVTGGNPFYVTEVLAQPGAAVPSTVRDAVLARVGRLTPASRAVVELVAVEPGLLSRSLVRRLGVRDRALDEALGAAVLVDHGSGVTVRHEIARLAVESSLPTERAEGLHRHFLDTLADDPEADPARLAHHATALRDPDLELRWSRAAAEHATRASASREAVRHYQRAVAHADRLSPTEAAELLTDYATALHAIDQAAPAVGVWERVVASHEAAGDHVGALAARAQLSRALWTAGRSADAYALIGEVTNALPTASDDPRVASAIAVSAYLAMLARRSAEAVMWADRAIELGEAVGNRTALAMALNARGAARIAGFEDIGGIDDLWRSGEIAAEIGERRSVVFTYSNIGSALGEIRRYDLAVSALQDGLAYATEHELEFGRHYSLAWLARIRFEQGRWDDAEALATQAIGGEEVSPISPMVALVVRGRVRARRGTPDARGSLEEAGAIAKASGDLQRTWPATAGLAEAAWLDEWEPAEVARIVVDLEAVLDDAQQRRLPWAIGELAFWLERLAARPAAHGGAARPYALSLAGAHQAAAAAWKAIGCPYEAAWARADIDDEPSLRAALGAFMSLGADPLAARVRRRLRELGVTGIPIGPRRSTATSPAGLTVREGEVLELLVGGLTDREIAERLVVSPRTVSHHVSAILAKLGVRRRTEVIGMSRNLAPRHPEKDG